MTMYRFRGTKWARRSFVDCNPRKEDRRLIKEKTHDPTERKATMEGAKTAKHKIPARVSRFEDQSQAGTTTTGGCRTTNLGRRGSRSAEMPMSRRTPSPFRFDEEKKIKKQIKYVPKTTEPGRQRGTMRTTDAPC